MKNIQSLHSHTNLSDGKLSHAQMLEAARSNGIRVLAFTDHDAVMSQECIATLSHSSFGGTKWISGIEISSGLPRELGGGVFSSFHITGLFVDPTNKDLLEHCSKAQEARVVRMQKMVKNLRSLGFDITEEDCFRASGGEAVARPHIVDALTQRPRNREIILAIKDQMEHDAQKDPKLMEKFNMLEQRGLEQYPYGLFLSDTSYMPEIYVEYQYWADMERSVELIRNAGGLAFIAHYSTARNKIQLELVEKLLKENMIDGIETVYGIYAYGTSEWPTIEADRQALRELTLKYSRLQSGGADAHTAENLKEFAEAHWYSGETEDFAEKIIQQTGVSTKWSSFS